MKFLYLWPFILLILIVLIILMYLLKQKAVDQQFSSLFLWKEMYRNMEANTPWEKLKKNWLMILQIITLIVLILALASPYLLRGGAGSNNVVLVIDNSAGMNTLMSNGKSRLDEAKSQAVDYVKQLHSGTKVTLVSCSQEALLLLSNCDERNEIIEKIKSVESTEYAGDCTKAVEMIESMRTQWDNFETTYFTDTYVKVGDTNGYMVDLSSNEDNLGIEYVGHGYNQDALVVLAKVTNYSQHDANLDINLYGDGALLDLKTLSVKAGESQVVYFENVDFKGEVIYAELSCVDALKSDNVCYDVLTVQEDNKVLLMTESNLYLEKAIGLIEHVEVTKSSDISSFSEFAAENYDLYVFDGMVPAELPKSGNMIFIHCKCEDLFNIQEQLSGVLVRTQELPLTKYLEDYEFGVGQAYAMEVPTWADSFLESDGKSVGFIGCSGTQTVCAIGFDFHDTDLPLKVEFPLMIYNIMGECVSSGMLSKNVINTGGQVLVNGKLDGEIPVATLPDGNLKQLQDSVTNFTDTKEVGIYRISQKQKDSEAVAFLAVNFPTSESKVNIITTTDDGEKDETVKTSVDVSLDLRNYVILLALVLLGVEWIFFLRR